MGIVNVTPDSFSDGGKFFDPGPAIDHALQLAADGASILDVGGESTRPYSQPVDEAEELRRILPVVRGIAARTTVPISIDTSKATVARAAIDAGAEIINDVTGLEGDPDMIDVAVQSGAGICAMHMQGTPQTMQDDPQYDDVVAEILCYLKQRKMGLLKPASRWKKFASIRGSDSAKPISTILSWYKTPTVFTNLAVRFSSAIHEKASSAKSSATKRPTVTRAPSRSRCSWPSKKSR